MPEFAISTKTPIFMRVCEVPVESCLQLLRVARNHFWWVSYVYCSFVHSRALSLSCRLSTGWPVRESATLRFPGWDISMRSEQSPFCSFPERDEKHQRTSPS